MTTVIRSYFFDRADPRTQHVTAGLIMAVCNHIVENIHPQKIILFGSRASGNPRTDSDLDLLVILPDSNPTGALSRRERARRILDLFPFRFFALDVMVITEGEIHELERANEGEWNLILELLQSGKEIYGQ